MQRCLCGCVALGLLMGRFAEQAKADYIFTMLNGDVAYGINDLGDVVGSSGGSYLYSGGSYTPLDVPGSIATLVRGINNAGQIVGYYVDNNRSYGFLLSGGTYTQFDVPGSQLTYAYGINNVGQIAGSYQLGSNTAGPDMGFVLSDGTFTTIQRPGAFYTRVYGINDLGQILGENFLLNQGSYTDIHYPGAVDSYAYGINNAGDIVGSYDDQTGLHGFLLSNGVYSSIDFPDSTATAIFGINNAGQIVGSYTDPAGYLHAFLATPRRSPHLPWTTFVAMSSHCTGDWPTPMMKRPPDKLNPKKSCGEEPSEGETPQNPSGAHHSGPILDQSARFTPPSIKTGGAVPLALSRK